MSSGLASSGTSPRMTRLKKATSTWLAPGLSARVTILMNAAVKLSAPMETPFFMCRRASAKSPSVS